MTVFSKIIDEETKELNCIECGSEPVIDGYTEIERELGYDGKWYVKGYAPEKPQEEIDQERIIELKNELNATDYKIIKCSECSLAGEELPYDIAALHAQRQALRDEINELENA